MSDVKLYLGDCLEFMQSMPDKSVDAVVTDPPYGVDWDAGYTRFTNGTSKREDFSSIHGDSTPFDPSPFLKFDKVVMFGANCFSDKLPCGSWFVWNKRFENGTAFLADGEVAWYSKGYGVYIKSVTQQGYVRPEKRLHPTQKPLAIMEWIISKVTKESDTVFDPFMGSGTTGVACVKLNRNFIGCEINPEYFNVAEERINQARADLGVVARPLSHNLSQVNAF